MPETTAKPKLDGLMAANRTPLENAEEGEVPFLEVLLTIERRHSGCNTPSEDLIHNLVLAYGLSGRLEAEDIDKEVADFKSDLACMIETAARFTDQYPDLVAAALAAA